jgi:hypothetical protein
VGQLRFEGKYLEPLQRPAGFRRSPKLRTVLPWSLLSERDERKAQCPGAGDQGDRRAPPSPSGQPGRLSGADRADWGDPSTARRIGLTAGTPGARFLRWRWRLRPGAGTAGGAVAHLRRGQDPGAAVRLCRREYPRVPRSESDQIVKALRTHGVPLSTWSHTMTDTRWDRRENQIELLTRCARFLEQALKGGERRASEDKID